MTTTYDKLDTINDSLNDIKTAIITKGQTPSGNITTYATAIDNIVVSSAVIEPLSITPTTSAQTITAPSGTDGYSPISVAAVTSSIDNNIVASNIVSGVSILGVNGSATVLNGETVNITPSTSAQTITPTSPKNGITQANVAAVTAAIDNNIQAGNIKKDVQILGVTGTYEGSGGGGSTPAERTVKANYWVDTSGVVHNLEDTSSATLSANATSLTTESFDSKYLNNTSVEKVDLSAIESISGTGKLERAFRLATNMTELDISGLKTISVTNALAQIADSAPIEKIAWPYSLNDITQEKTFTQAFQGHNLSGVIDLTWVHTVSGTRAFASAFKANSAKVSGITKVDLSNLTSITGGYAFSSVFQNLSDVTANIIDISNLETVTGQCALGGLTQGLSGNYVFPKLSNIAGSYALQYGCDKAETGSSISFPALTSTSFGSYTNQFNKMLNGRTNCTVHFPSNLQAVIGSWSDVTAGFGGTNTTVLFDLPATS